MNSAAPKVIHEKKEITEISVTSFSLLVLTFTVVVSLSTMFYSIHVLPYFGQIILHCRGIMQRQFHRFFF